MFIAVCGTALVILGACISSKEFVFSGAAFLALDISLELTNIKNQMYHNAVGIRDALRELKEKK